MRQLLGICDIQINVHFYFNLFASFSMISIFSLVKTLKLSLRSLIFLDILMASDMLRTFSDWTIFVQISSLTKSTFCLSTAVCNIPWGETALVPAELVYSTVLNHSFSVYQTSFLVKLLLVSFFFSGQNLLDWNLNLLSFLFQ